MANIYRGISVSSTEVYHGSLHILDMIVVWGTSCRPRVNLCSQEDIIGNSKNEQKHDKTNVKLPTF